MLFDLMKHDTEKKTEKIFDVFSGCFVIPASISTSNNIFKGLPRHHLKDLTADIHRYIHAWTLIFYFRPGQHKRNWMCTAQ